MREQLPETAVQPEKGVVYEMANEGDALLERLYDTYSTPLFRYALALTCSRDDAEDAVQAVFIRVAREWKRLVGIEDVKAYLFSAVRNAAFNILRSKRRRKALHESVCAAFGTNPQSESGAGRIEAQVICEAMDALPVDQREVLVLKIFDEMSFREIADTVGVSINTVASRYRYGIEKLRGALEVDDDG